VTTVEMADDIGNSWAAIGRSNTLMLGYLACQITAMSLLLCEVNKFVLACVILFRHINFMHCPLVECLPQ